MKFLKSLFIAIIVSCVSLQMNAKEPVAGMSPPCWVFLGQASGELNDLMSYIEKKQNFSNTARFASKKDSDNWRKEVSMQIKKKIEKIKQQLDSAIITVHSAVY